MCSTAVQTVYQPDRRAAVLDASVRGQVVCRRRRRHCSPSPVPSSFRQAPHHPEPGRLVEQNVNHDCVDKFTYPFIATWSAERWRRRRPSRCSSAPVTRPTDLRSAQSSTAQFDRVDLPPARKAALPTVTSPNMPLDALGSIETAGPEPSKTAR